MIKCYSENIKICIWAECIHIDLKIACVGYVTVLTFSLIMDATAGNIIFIMFYFGYPKGFNFTSSKKKNNNNNYALCLLAVVNTFTWIL